MLIPKNERLSQDYPTFKGHIGLLTNIYAGKSAPGAGRGFLVINALKENNPENYLKNLTESDVKYSPFNLLLLEPKGVVIFLIKELD